MLYDWFREHNEGNPVINLPTGSGKSFVIAYLCQDALQNWPETRTLILTHQQELIEQNHVELINLWPNAPAGIYSAGLGISFLYYWPTLLALVSRAAPARLNSTLMGLAFMSLFVSNNLIGWIGGFYEKMSPAQFWAMHAAIAAGGGLLVIVFGRPLSRALQPASPINGISPNRPQSLG